MKALYKKISLVMKDIQYLQKDDNVSFGSGSYKALSEEKVTETVRKSLIEHGLIIIPVSQTHRRDDTVLSKTYKGDVKESVDRLTTVDVTYKIIDIDTGDFEEIVSSGTGVDTQDKGVGKAMTYAYKYMLLRTFAIPTGDDPDKVSSEKLDEEKEGAKTKTPEESDRLHKARLVYRDLLLKHPHVFTKDDIAKFSDKPEWGMSEIEKAHKHIQKLKKEREDILQHEAHEN